MCELFSSKSQTDIIYLDFKKAFDSVAHNELLVKLWSFGITGNLWWGYLSSRHQCVIINHCISDPLPVISVVSPKKASWSDHEHLKYISSRAYKFLGLIRRSFSGGHLPGSKNILYISLFRSQLTYCSQIWRPHLLKDITSLERIQRRATKFILNDFSSDYKSHLVALQILPLMMQLELYDLMFS